MTKIYDLAVIGAGPAGSSTAEPASKLGLNVILLEEHPRVGAPQHCAGILAKEGIEKFNIKGIFSWQKKKE